MRFNRSGNGSGNGSAQLPDRTIRCALSDRSSRMVGGRGFYPPPIDDQSDSSGNRSGNGSVVLRPPMKVMVRLGLPSKRRTIKPNHYPNHWFCGVKK